MAIINKCDLGEDSLYTTTVIRHKVCLPFSEIHNFKDLQTHLMQRVSAQVSGRCIAEGFVKPGSCIIRSHTIGVFMGGNVSFNLEIECMVCCPHEGTVMQCIAKTVTQAGIRAHARMDPSPVVVYISREFESDTSQNRAMNSVKPGDCIAIRILGKRFELNDKHVTVIGECVSI